MKFKIQISANDGSHHVPREGSLHDGKLLKFISIRVSVPLMRTIPITGCDNGGRSTTDQPFDLELCFSPMHKQDYDSTYLKPVAGEYPDTHERCSIAMYKYYVIH